MDRRFFASATVPVALAVGLAVVRAAGAPAVGGAADLAVVIARGEAPVALGKVRFAAVADAVPTGFFSPVLDGDDVADEVDMFEVRRAVAARERFFVSSSEAETEACARRWVAVAPELVVELVAGLRVADVTGGRVGGLLKPPVARDEAAVPAAGFAVVEGAIPARRAVAAADGLVVVVVVFGLVPFAVDSGDLGVAFTGVGGAASSLFTTSNESASDMMGGRRDDVEGYQWCQRRVDRLSCLAVIGAAKAQIWLAGECSKACRDVEMVDMMKLQQRVRGKSTSGQVLVRRLDAQAVSWSSGLTSTSTRQRSAWDWQTAAASHACSSSRQEPCSLANQDKQRNSPLNANSSAPLEKCQSKWSMKSSCAKTGPKRQPNTAGNKYQATRET